MPKGGYFISYDTPKGCAKKVEEMCKKAGVILTPAGSTYPSGLDPDDTNLRIAPSFPPIEDLKLAAHILALSTKIVAIDKMI